MPSFKINACSVNRYPGKSLLFAILASLILQVVALAQDSAYSRGCSAFDREDWNGAIAAFTEAIQEDPSNDLAYYRRGLAYKKNNEPDKSWKDFDKACELKPGSEEYDKARQEVSLNAYNTTMTDAVESAKKLNKKRKYESQLPVRIVMSIISLLVIVGYWFGFKKVAQSKGEPADTPAKIMRMVGLVSGIFLSLLLGLYILFNLLPP